MQKNKASVRQSQIRKITHLTTEFNKITYYDESPRENWCDSPSERLVTKRHMYMEAIRKIQTEGLLTIQLPKQFWGKEVEIIISQQK